MRGSVHIGTSGWAYNWDKFYRDTPKSRRLEFLSGKFSTAEINYSFYHLPRRSTFKKWYEETPDSFIFSIKLSRYITHIKKLKRVKTSFKKFLRRAKVLDKKLGPVLIQLPPSFRANPERMEGFLKDAWDSAKELGIKSKFRPVVEVRHKSWFDKKLFKMLEKNKTALAFSDGENLPYPEEEPITADFVYIRLHGPGKLYSSKYKEADLKNWKKKIEAWKRENLDVFVYFDNDGHGYAPENAMELASYTYAPARANDPRNRK